MLSVKKAAFCLRILYKSTETVYMVLVVDFEPWMGADSFMKITFASFTQHSKRKQRHTLQSIHLLSRQHNFAILSEFVWRSLA